MLTYGALVGACGPASNTPSHSGGGSGEGAGTSSGGGPGGAASTGSGGSTSSGSSSATGVPQVCQPVDTTVPTVPRDRYVTNANASGSFPLLASGQAAPLVVSSSDFPGVLRIAKQLQSDLNNIGGVSPQLVDTVPAASHAVVIIGTIGKSPVINQLVQAGKLDVSKASGRFETFVTQVVNQPMAGVDQALVIAGSDKRGTIYGMLDLSTQSGVSPWYWWADVPIPPQKALYVLPGAHTLGTPTVKYRGFFVNDESPALSGMVKEKFGGYKQAFYSKVFELLLRLKANYLWPAMWGSAFNTDDPGNEALADDYGIVMGTSHQEPMMRAQKEWDSLDASAWDYTTNTDAIRKFWTGGIQRMGSFESLVTIGMRGENDTSLSPTTNISLLQQIMSDQRTILQTVTGKDPSKTPQVWTIYKDIQAYYNQGVSAPDDVITVFSDDNWGNLLRLPPADAPARAGGYGIYYHYDYVGGPRSYKWLNTNPISRVWEQLHIAYAYGGGQLWLVNVGDIKPMEFPTQFFFDYAWDPDRWPAASLPDYTRQWAAQQFGDTHASAIENLLTLYTKFNARRKPELLDPTTYSLTDYREAETVVSSYNDLATTAQSISDSLPANYKDAFNRGQGSFSFTATSSAPWLTVTPSSGKVTSMKRLLVTADWTSAPMGTRTVPITLTGSDGSTVVVNAAIHNPATPSGTVRGFVESAGYVSIESEHYSCAVPAGPITWQRIPDLGRTSSGITLLPATAPRQIPGGTSARLEYPVYFFSKGTIKVNAYLSPTQDMWNKGLNYGVSFDEDPVQTVNIVSDSSQSTWGTWVRAAINVQTTTHTIVSSGAHVLKFWAVDPGVVLQKIVIETTGAKKSYLGPPESVE